MSNQISLNEEILRMKNLSNYQKGIVISEQNFILKEEYRFVKFPCLNPSWPIKTASLGTNLRGAERNNIQFIYPQGGGKVKNPNGTNFYNLDDISISEEGKWYWQGTEIGTFYCKDGKLLFNGNPIIKPEKQTVKNPNKTTPTPKKTIPIPKELQVNDGVKIFQGWLDTKFPEGWAESKRKPGFKYTIKRRPEWGFGVFGGQTSKMWNDKNIRDEFLNSGSL